MSEQQQPTGSEWKKALRESGALGWAALGALIVVVVIGAFVLGQKPAATEAKVPAQSTTR